MPAQAPDATARREAAGQLLDGFLRETGVVGTNPPRRYLWTDAFAVCCLLELHRMGDPPPRGETSDLDLALRLVDQVHGVLGRHREDDPRTGWLSGLPEQEGAARPTAGGLRIGKPLRERRAGEPVNERLEWDRDGQYFHYLTRWMHALLRVSEETGEGRYLVWAVELARVAYRGFLRGGTGGQGGYLAWKMSVDLSRPLVDSPGHHDPLDGHITFRALASRGHRTGLDVPMLEAEARHLGEMAGISRAGGWATRDPLGLGGLLTDAWRVLQLLRVGEEGVGPLLSGLLDAAAVGLEAWRRTGPLEAHPGDRLPFRELGLAIGIHALYRARALPVDLPGLRDRLEAFGDLAPVAGHIEETWLHPTNRFLDCWTGHEDINAVMLATSLIPDGYLGR